MEQVLATLQNWGIPYIKHDHPAVYTCEEAAAHCQHIPGVKSKNLFLRDKKGKNHYLVVLKASQQINLKELGKAMGIPGLSFASPERLFKYLQVKPGSVSPFGLIFDTENHVQVLLSKEVLAADGQQFHPNHNEHTLEIKTEDFKKFLDKIPHSVSYF